MRPTLLVLLAAVAAPSFAYQNQATFPVILKMDSASINGDVAAAVGNFAFPEYKGVVKAVTQWAATLKGLDVHVQLTVNPETLTFAPNSLTDRALLKGLRTVQIPISSVKDIYETTSGWNDFKSLILVSGSGTLLFHLDGDGLGLFTDFEKARADLTNTLTRVCGRAAFHQVRE